MQPQWVFEKGIAKVEAAGWQGLVDPTKPAQTTKISSQGAGAEGWQIFSVEPQPPHALTVDESYIRQTDLIAQYAQNPEDDFAFHLYWRKLPLVPGEQFGLELWLGVQTGLLDSMPKLNVGCISKGSSGWETFTHQQLSEEADPSGAASGPAALVSKSEGSTGVWLVEPSDQRHTVLLPTDSKAAARVQVFGHFMEKGVIRRGRMRFLILDADAGLAAVKEAYARFSASELPLTA